MAISAGHEAPIDLILTDIVMPQMSGNDLVERLLAERSGIRVLFMSGYTGDSRIKGDELFPAAAFLAKPFSPRNLTLKIREVLDDNRVDFFAARKNQRHSCFGYRRASSFLTSG